MPARSIWFRAASGLIGRFPVSLSVGGETNRFWGIVSAVIDVDRLYRDSGLLSQTLDLDIAISGRDGLGEEGALFYGDSTVKSANPVEVNVFLPGGSWVISAVPKGGWDDTPPNAWLIRSLVLLGGLFILVPMFITGRLMQERQRNIRVLEHNKDQLQELSHRLKIALDASQIGIWELDISSGKLLWDERMKELYGLHGDVREVYEDWRDALHPDDLQRAEEEFSDALLHGSELYLAIPHSPARQPHTTYPRRRLDLYRCRRPRKNRRSQLGRDRPMSKTASGSKRPKDRPRRTAPNWKLPGIEWNSMPCTIR